MKKDLYEKFLEKRVELFSDELDDWVFAITWDDVKKILSENELVIEGYCLECTCPSSKCICDEQENE